MATILDTIVAKKHEEVAELRRQGLPAPTAVDAPRGFMRALTAKPGVAIIAEAKKASPSKGLIEPNFDPVQVAKHYKENGAAAISVLTDRHFFQGELDFLIRIRKEVDLPVLRKDFIIDPLQIEEAHRAGADAILLIAAILSPAQLQGFREQAEGLGMDALVEVHDEAELGQALVSGARLIGINNRNLHDFTVDLDTSFRLKALVPEGIPVVSESGITKLEDILRLKKANIDAALIGESLMRSGSSGTLLQEFTSV
ncbi:MAG: indole-3-glycerol phosphate synthase TrpC [bacterium]|nr:indole-3-glycerol phosphate synthase TrpC [bacterium]